MGEILALLSLGMFSANILIVKAASNRLVTDVGIVIVITMNVIVSSLLVLGELLSRGLYITWNTKGFLLFVVTGIFSTYLGRWFFIETIVRIGPVRASAFQVSNPIFTVLITWLILGDAITGSTAVAIVAVLIGLVLVSYIPGAFTGEQDPVVSETRSKWEITRFLLPLASSLAYAIGNVLRGVGVQAWNEPIVGAFLGALSGFILYALTNSVVWRISREVRQADRLGIGLFAISGVLSISAQTCVIASMHYIPISIANLITLSTPVIVTPMSYFLFKNRENITVRTVMGLVLVMGGITFLVLK